MAKDTGMIRDGIRIGLRGLGATAAGLLLVAELPAQEETATAEGPDTSTWGCSRCPFQDGWSGSVAVGGSYVSDAEQKFGDYTGFDDDGFVPGAGALLQYANEDGYSVDMGGFGYNDDSFNYTIEAGHQGRWMSRLELDRLPRRLGDSTRTVYRNTGDSPLRLEDDWVRAGSTAGMTALDDNSRSFNVSSDRETIGLDLDYLFTPNLTLDTAYRYQTKEGKGVTWGSFLGNAAQLAKPIDYDTHEAEAGLNYARETWQLRGSVRGSWFNNSDRALTWDNAFTGVDRGRMSQAPDNKAYYADLGGTWQVLSHTTASATASIGKFEQDDDFLPYTINPNILTAPLPATDLDGEVDVTHFDLRVTSSPFSRVRVTGEYRYDERDNGSRVANWRTISADSIAGATERNLPYDYKRWDADVFADLRVAKGFKTSFGYTYRETERNLQEVDTQEEDIYWAKLRLRPSHVFTMDIKFESSSRENDDYDQVDYFNLAQNPLQRKYNMAERDRKGVEAQATIMPNDRLSLGLRAESWDDDYDESEVGVTDGNRKSFVADATFQLSDKISTFASVGHETMESKQWGAQSNVNPNTADPNWRADNDDEFNLASVGFRWDRILERWAVEVDYTYAESEGDIQLQSFGLQDQFPSLDTRTNTARLNVMYALSEKIQLVGGWWYQRYRSDDWALDGVNQDTIGSVLTWGGNSPDYEVNVISFGFNYSLAPPPTAPD
jgi:MtrB/PioB family decaheme-associated outer membrane protein